MGHDYNRSFVLSILVLTCACTTSFAQPVITVTSFPESQKLPYIGNGIVGYRPKPNPLWGWKATVSGFTASDPGGWETLAYGPYPFTMDLELDDSPSMVELGEKVTVKSQSLDLATGELTTRLEFPMGSGTAKVEVLQFASRATPAIACQEVKITVPQAGTLRTQVGIAPGPDNEIVVSEPPGHGKVTHLMLGLEHKTKRNRCGVSTWYQIDAHRAQLLPLKKSDPQTTRTFVFEVDAGQTLTIRTFASTVTSLYHPEPVLESCRILNWAKSLGFDKVRRQNRDAWAEIWKSRVKVTGDEAAQKYLDCCLYYMMSSVHASGRTSMAPFGLSQAKNYFGHVFWDTDTYTTPALLLIDPDIAKMTIDFRLRNLEAARKQAAIYGFKGAMYPWESGTLGEEATPSMVDTGWLQQHVNMCVSIAAWWYQMAAGDEDYARNTTWPIIKSVAEWVASRVEKTDRGYEIRDTMSSHEGAKIQNSLYVNSIAAEALRVGNRCAKRVGDAERPEWNEIAENMFLPIGPAGEGSGIDGDILWMHEEGWIKEGPSVDMFMIGFPFDLPFERDMLKRTYDFYMTLPNKTLSMGVVFFIGDAAFLGDREGQRRLFDRTLKEKWEPVWGMGTEYSDNETTCFVTTMGGMLQTVLMGMTGLRFEPDHWTKYDACLPTGWEKIECDRIWLGGKTYRLEAVNGQKAKLTPTR